MSDESETKPVSGTSLAEAKRIIRTNIPGRDVIQDIAKALDNAFHEGRKSAEVDAMLQRVDAAEVQRLREIEARIKFEPEKCLNCKFFGHIVDESKLPSGQCCKNAPGKYQVLRRKPVSLTTVQMVPEESAFPAVSPHAWCGEYVRREPAAQAEPAVVNQAEPAPQAATVCYSVNRNGKCGRAGCHVCKDKK